MSTFNGLIEGFPGIRVDYFRGHPTEPRPVACFLSHIHSDHLAGLETLLSPFIYCSAATREMLLRLEKYPSRINYEQGILETRKQTYKHLRKLLKPIPLHTPTKIETSLHEEIQVTLFDANHCPGSVMFLFEREGMAALYTGDIRSEPWFVNNIAQNPSLAHLAKYASGPNRIHTVYLDTSFTEDIHFQTKAKGIEELRRKIQGYSDDTVFHFQAWTYGYEDIWCVLSEEIGSKIHVDDCKLGMYRSLLSKDKENVYGAPLSPEASKLVGFMCGNRPQEGCLTSDITARIHSCEKGAYCETMKMAMKTSKVVWIRPIVAHLPDGQDIVEVGVGGGGTDLERDTELEGLSGEDINSILELVLHTEGIPNDLETKIRSFLLKMVPNGRNIPLDLKIADSGQITLTDVIESMAKKSKLGGGTSSSEPRETGLNTLAPRIITFPYSRHSSYEELCHFLSIFKPRDVWPCTVSPIDWHENEISIRGLFGEHCSGDVFRHDVLMERQLGEFRPRHYETNSQSTTSSVAIPIEVPKAAAVSPARRTTPTNTSPAEKDPVNLKSGYRKRDYQEYTADGPQSDNNQEWQDSQSSLISEYALEIRTTAYRALLANARGSEVKFVGLISTTDNHSTIENEL